MDVYHSRANSGKMNKLHERCLQTSFETLLEKVGCFCAQSYIQTLATEMYKIKNDLSLLIVTKLFRQRNEQHQDLRQNT